MLTQYDNNYLKLKEAAVSTIDDIHNVIRPQDTDHVDLLKNIHIIKNNAIIT